jgi:hypothetical protein
MSWRVEWVCMVNMPVGSMSRSWLMGSWLNVMRGCVHGVGNGSGKMGVMVGAKPELKAIRAVGLEGVTDGVVELEAKVPLDFV